MGLEDLLAALERHAEEKTRTLLDAAKQEAARISAETERRLARRRETALAEREDEVRARAEAEIAETRRQSRRRVLVARERLLERVFAAARDSLPEAVAGEAYLGALPVHLDQALSYVPVEVEIACPPALVERVRDLARSHDRARVTPDPEAITGIRVRATDGSLVVDNTLSRRLERLRPALAIEVIRRIDG